MKADFIYFDMDGVLADFDNGVRELCHMEPMQQTKSTPEDHDRLYEAIRQVENFYAKLKPIEEGLQLLKKVYAKYGSRCAVLTGIPKPSRGLPTAAEQKVQWIADYVSPDIQVHTVLRKEKVQFCSGSSCILIDDFIANIRQWQKYGGTGILYKNAAETEAKLKKLGIL